MSQPNGAETAADVLAAVHASLQPPPTYRMELGAGAYTAQELSQPPAQAAQIQFSIVRAYILRITAPEGVSEIPLREAELDGLIGFLQSERARG